MPWVEGGQTVQLTSSVPGIYAAFLALIEAAAGGQTPPVHVFPFEVTQYEPAQYIMLSGIEGPEYEWATIGSYSQKETYNVWGKVTVFDGRSLGDNPAVATQVMNSTFSLFQTCVMDQALTNRTEPILGTTGPSPQQMLPVYSKYTAGPGRQGDAQVGWEGTIEFAFSFLAYLVPIPV